jgi:hypothetical protein
MTNYESLVDALDDLRKRGYAADFATEQMCLYCGDLDLRLHPEDFNIDEVYRFEGDSSADDSAVLYAITSTSGLKGTLVDGYGIYNDNLSFEMARKLQMHPLLTPHENSFTTKSTSS